jgi:hypothetical protein
MIRQDVFGAKRGDPIQNGQPTRRCAAIAENSGHGLVLNNIASTSSQILHTAILRLQITLTQT